MNDFEKMPPGNEREQKDIADELFPNRDIFSQKVKEALEWSERGGPEVGTRSFLKAVYNEEAEGKLTSEKFGKLNRRIKQEVKNIKNQEEQSPDPDKEKGKAFTEEETARMIEESEKMQWRESKRSGGVDPNEI